MKDKIFVFICLLLCSFQAFSQFDFRSGYIIKNNNDTIYGLIDYKGSKSSAKTCTFKKDLNSKNQTFAPDDLLEYKFVENKCYVSRLVPSENGEVKLFLEYLINGTVDMYYYRDDKGEHYFVDKGDNVLLELKNEEKEIYINEIKYVKESKEYVGLLKYVFSQSPTISKRAEKISLNHKSLIKVARDYHNEICPDEQCVVYEGNVPKVIARFGSLIGINYFTMVVGNDQPDQYDYLLNSDFGNQFYPSFGVFFKINLPSINEKLSLQYDLLISKVSLETLNTYTIAGLRHINTIKLTNNILGNTISVKYEFPGKKIQPTLQIGGFIDYSYSSEYNRNSLSTHTSNYYTENPFPKANFGLSVGFGFKTTLFETKEFFMDIKFQRGTEMLYSVHTNCILLNLGIQLL